MVDTQMKRTIGLIMLCLFFAGCFNIKTEAAGKTYYNSYGVAVKGAYAMGIDVSSNNGSIDWNAVKASGVEFAVIRCGCGMNLLNQDDKQWEANVAGCESVGIPYGVYLYSYADSVSRAKDEAEHVLRLISGHKLSYPVYYDMEDSSVLRNTTAEQRGKIAKAFCDRIQAAGYKVGIYADKSTFTNLLAAKEFQNKNKWVAHYSSACGYTGTYQMWQATNQGKVSGIRGNVDINYLISGQIFIKPVIKVSSPAKKKVKITWKPKKSGTTCEIYYAKKKTGKYKLLRKNAKKGSAIIKGLKSGKKYYIRVRISKKVYGSTVYSKCSKIKAIKVR